MSLYLRNATWIDPETFKATTTTIKVEEGLSGGMALDAHAPAECPPEDAVLDCTGRLVMPSFGCGHHHIYSALARGMPPAPKAPANFLEVLEYVWWRMDKKLDHDMIDYLQGNEFNFIVCLTKADKLSRTQQARQAAAIKKQLNVPAENVIITSSQTGTGSDELKRRSAEACL